MGPIEYNMTGP